MKLIKVKGSVMYILHSQIDYSCARDVWDLVETPAMRLTMLSIKDQLREEFKR